MSGGSADADARGGRRSTLLSARDIAALNRARQVLRHIEDAAWRQALDHFDPYAPVSSWDLGRLSEAASAADAAIFHVLSTARNDCHVKVSDGQLFGTERASARAETALEAVPLTEVPTQAPTRASSRHSPRGGSGSGDTRRSSAG